MKNLVLTWALFLLSVFLFSSCASMNAGDPTRPYDAKKHKKAINQSHNSRFNSSNR